VHVFSVEPSGNKKAIPGWATINEILRVIDLLNYIVLEFLAALD
jgi:hypothetical protein